MLETYSVIVCTIAYEKTTDVAERITMTYIPSHLYQMLFELFKVSYLRHLVCLILYRRMIISAPEIKVFKIAC